MLIYISLSDHYHSVIKPLYPHLNLSLQSRPDEIDNYFFAVRSSKPRRTSVCAERTRSVDRYLFLSEGTASGREDSVRQPFSSRLWVAPDGRALNPCSTPFYSTKAVRKFSTPSPLPPGITLGSASDRPPRGGGNAAAHIAGQEFAIRVCAARLRLRSRLSLSNGPVPSWRSCQVRFRAGCPTADEIEEPSVTVAVRYAKRAGRHADLRT